MKQILKILALIIAIVAGYLLVLQLYPKNAGRYPFLIILLLGDYYLWAAFKDWVNNRKPFLKYLLGFLYWLPFMLLLGTTIVSINTPPDAWPDALRIYIFGFIFIAYAAKLLPILFLVLADIFRGFQFIHTKAITIAKRDTSNHSGSKITRSEFIKRAGLVSGSIVFSGLFLGMLKWVFDFKLHQHRVNIPGLPDSFDGFKVVQISDIHLGSWSSKTALQEAVDRINDLKPDAIFFTGDLVNNKTEEAYPFEGILAKFRAKNGVYATLGNHDYGDYVRWPSKEAKDKNMTDLFDLYQRMGWKLLNNENRVFSNPDGKLAIVGVENWGDFGRFPKYGDVEKAVAGTEDADVKLLLSHDPSHWDRVVTKDFQDIDITFSGHTHGFQFGIEIKNIKWSPAQYAYKHWAGMYEQSSNKNKTQRLYVNRGLGTIGYPGRVGILPEITLIELKKA